MLQKKKAGKIEACSQALRLTIAWSVRSAQKQSVLKFLFSILFQAVIAVVFLTLLSVVVIIVVYLYKNKGNYHTYEQPEADPEGSVQMEDFPCKREKEEYFI